MLSNVVFYAQKQAYCLSPIHRLVIVKLRGDGMKGAVEERAVELGAYIVDNNATVRATAKKFHISKSTVHKDVTERLKGNNPQLFAKVKLVLDKNKSERHIRGGMATRKKYKGI